MTPWTQLEQALTPSGEAIDLWKRGADYSIRVRGQLLMNSRVHGSEQALAELALGALGQGVPRPRVLVGGLGFGYTLAAALQRLGSEARVTVAELVPAVVRWNREHVGHLAGSPLLDPRVTVHEGDICTLLSAGGGAFECILLDVDNGPAAVTQDSNAWLYTPKGLSALHASVAPQGSVAIWSAGPEAGFSARLARPGFQVELHRVRSSPSMVRQNHFIWVGKRA